ncbi:MAG: CDP-alcohol phosphatidyltransferase family protein [Salinispira sp.]
MRMRIADHNKLIKSINLCVSALLIIHSSIFIILALIFMFPQRLTFSFITALILYHIMLIIGLSRLSDLFVYSQTGGQNIDSQNTDRQDTGGHDHTISKKRLDHINIPIILTLMRITSLVTIIVLIFLIHTYPLLNVLIVYMITAFITDLLDGIVSRRTRQTTIIGAYLDSISDYAMLFTISIAYFRFHLLPDWFIILVIIRLAFQATIVIGISIRKGSMEIHRSSVVAKAAIFLVMLTYACALLRLFSNQGPIYLQFMSILEWICTIVLLVSLMEKCMLFLYDLRSRKQKMREVGGAQEKSGE